MPSAAEVSVSEPRWRPDGIGTGYLLIRNERWDSYDFQDTLPTSLAPSDALGICDKLGLTASAAERRQCALLGLAGGLLWADTGTVPPLEEVQREAWALIAELWDQAVSASHALGDSPAWVTEPEALVRMHCHDLVYLHHDKDHRCVPSFPLRRLRSRWVHVHRVDPLGSLAD